MNKILSVRIFLSTIFLAGCGLGINNESLIMTPAFITATLPATNAPQLEPQQIPSSPIPEAATAVLQTIEGVTTTQLNLRSQPSTAGESLGMVAAFSTIQIIGRESYGKWYQIADATSPTGNGWIIASYVQVKGTGEIPVIALGLSGLVVQGLNVRNGPGRDYTSLGTLVANDIVSVTGKDVSGGWLQVNFKGQPGWVAAEFMLVENSESLAIVADQGDPGTSTIEPNSAVSPPILLEDNDALEAPIASVKLEAAGAGRLQLNGFISPTSGDEADWVQFAPSNRSVTIQIKCAPDSLRLDVYEDSSLVREDFLKCNEIKILNTVPGQFYTLKLGSNAAAIQPTPYSVFINIVR